MASALIRWFRSWRRTWRYKARANDAQFLFPAIWSVTRPDAIQFLWAATAHTSSDPNWVGHEDEWSQTPVDPGTWLAMKRREEQR